MTLDTRAGFFSAQFAAGAALLGLIFVGLSLNLTRILSEENLPRRAEISMVLLVLQLVVASIALIPGQSLALVGVEVLLAAGLAWGITTAIGVAILRHARSDAEQQSGRAPGRHPALSRRRRHSRRRPARRALPDRAGHHPVVLQGDARRLGAGDRDQQVTPPPRQRGIAGTGASACGASMCSGTGGTGGRSRP
ncbi:MAG: hypothetical protein QM699_05890 [Amaricoccus sp.]|uniref:hypothetical protein n=1 Tax=Amaricoccus sp. TaxID=1872485 RepID=UPI0039E23101